MWAALFGSTAPQDPAAAATATAAIPHDGTEDTADHDQPDIATGSSSANSRGVPHLTADAIQDSDDDDDDDDDEGNQEDDKEEIKNAGERHNGEQTSTKSEPKATAMPQRTDDGFLRPLDAHFVRRPQQSEISGISGISGASGASESSDIRVASVAISAPVEDVEFPMIGGPQRISGSSGKSVNIENSIYPAATAATAAGAGATGNADRTAERMAVGRGRHKVPLGAGHSPLDWARLVASGADLRGGATQMQRFTVQDLAEHKTRTDAWLALRGKVYNVTRYIDFHPGGAGQLLRGAGKDATELFMRVHPWVNFDALLDKCCIGFLI